MDEVGQNGRFDWEIKSYVPKGRKRTVYEVEILERGDFTLEGQKRLHWTEKFYDRAEAEAWLESKVGADQVE